MQDEIPEADVVSDDGGSGDGGDVCEVISPFSFFLLLDVCENIETVLLFLTETLKQFYCFQQSVT